jgi:hypothetical protein
MGSCRGMRGTKFYRSESNHFSGEIVGFIRENMLPPLREGVCSLP